MQITLRHAYAAVQLGHPDFYEEWRTALAVNERRLDAEDASAAFTSLFLEQFWAHREEIHDLLHSPGVLSLYIATTAFRKTSKFAISIRAYVVAHSPYGSDLQAPAVQTAARNLPRAADFSSACTHLKERVRTL